MTLLKKTIITILLFGAGAVFGLLLIKIAELFT